MEKMNSKTLAGKNLAIFNKSGSLALMRFRNINQEKKNLGQHFLSIILNEVYEILPQHKNHEETFAACDKAIKLANDKTVSPTPEVIETLGGGWIAEEALAISIYCSLVYPNDFKKAVLLAVNHSGDSDSTGAITGKILGALHGAETIPNYWLERLELKEAIAEIAKDLSIGFTTGDEWWNIYPGI